MPEAALGLHTDCGSSFWLSHLPGHLGEYLALTGSRLDGAEMLACGLATHFVPLEVFTHLCACSSEIRLQISCTWHVNVHDSPFWYKPVLGSYQGFLPGI
jgi:enoyl-CoA hydratase/carnithine racemase